MMCLVLVLTSISDKKLLFEITHINDESPVVS